MDQIHLIEKVTAQKPLNRDEHLWESGDWDVSASKAEALVGKRIYFHKAQSAPSHFGGSITSCRVLGPDHPQAGRVAFTFKADEQGRGVYAGPTGWGNEQKTVCHREPIPESQ